MERKTSSDHFDKIQKIVQDIIKEKMEIQKKHNEALERQRTNAQILGNLEQKSARVEASKLIEASEMSEQFTMRA